MMNKLTKKYFAILTIVLFTYFAFLSIGASSSSKEQTSNKGLIATHKVLSKQYKNVPHIKAKDITKMDENSYVLFDVREKDEYAVSHIKKAIWVNPSIDASTFYKQYSHKIQGKTLILYCSVGARSTSLATKLLLNAKQNQQRVFNLENGIFGWHNESRPLFQSSKPTEFIHPYNGIWGKMVNRKELKRYNLNDSTVD